MTWESDEYHQWVPRHAVCRVAKQIQVHENHTRLQDVKWQTGCLNVAWLQHDMRVGASVGTVHRITSQLAIEIY